MSGKRANLEVVEVEIKCSVNIISDSAELARGMRMRDNLIASYKI
tara:strand:- start:543 stop:677 length:135 start_codon:yes stop_codon:yes gene_type:complete